MTFKDFIASWREGTLDKDAAWRAYAVSAQQITDKSVAWSVKHIGLAYAGELAMSEFQAQYGVPDRSEAEAILAAWYWFAQAQAGKRVRGLKPRAQW